VTGDEIIALARSHYGEETPNIVSADMAKDFLNAALMELYEDLPTERLKHLISTDSLSLTAGKGEFPDEWDKILEVHVNGSPAILVGREVIHNTDYGQLNLFEPVIPIFHINESHVWVRPTGSTVEVVYLGPPDVIDNFESEVTVFEEQWHAALASLVASFMYAQEEDLQQAQQYRADYQQRISSLLQGQGAEA
jgi:hypothetical protein